MPSPCPSETLPKPACVASFRSLGTMSGVEMAVVQGRTHHQHVTAGELWLEEVSLIHYDHGVLNLALDKVHSHYPLIRRLAQAPFDQAL